VLKIISLMLGLAMSIYGSALAGEKYSFHENLHVGQKVPFTLVYDADTKTTTTINGISSVTDSETKYQWKVTLTIEAVKDGSAIRAQADIDPTNTDTITTSGSTSTIPCSYAGKSVVISENPDNSFSNNFTGSARDDDTDLLNNFITPDEDYYPDQPVAIGDSWDNSAKLSKHSSLGPNDQMLSQCRLDWVKTIDGKPMAQFSNSYAAVYHEAGHLEEDYEATCTFLVDMNRQMIVKADQTATSTYKTPADSTAQITGGVKNTFHCECGE